MAYWKSDESVDDIKKALRSSDEADIVKSLLSISGSFWQLRNESAIASSIEVYDAIERKLFENSNKIRISAAWAWGFWRHIKIEKNQKVPLPSNDVIALLVSMFLCRSDDNSDLGRFTLPNLSGVPRNSFDIPLTQDQYDYLSYLMSGKSKGTFIGRSEVHVSTARIAFILKDYISDIELIKYIKSYKGGGSNLARINEMLAELGETKSRKTRKPLKL